MRGSGYWQGEEEKRQQVCFCSNYDAPEIPESNPQKKRVWKVPCYYTVRDVNCHVLNRKKVIFCTFVVACCCQQQRKVENKTWTTSAFPEKNIAIFILAKYVKPIVAGIFFAKAEVFSPWR